MFLIYKPFIVASNRTLVSLPFVGQPVHAFKAFPLSGIPLICNRQFNSIHKQSKRSFVIVWLSVVYRETRRIVKASWPDGPLRNKKGNPMVAFFSFAQMPVRSACAAS
jgi:hypothetical protein